MRKISVFTGTRAEYGILTPVMKAINKHPNLDLDILVSSMHLEKEFGNTLEEIQKDFPGNQIKPYRLTPSANTRVGKLEEMAECMVQTGHEISGSDTLVILGDRYETFAAGLAAVTLGVPLAHIHGGDKTKSGIDESYRHALTKLANIHFPATEKSYERIIKLGENPKNVFLVGSPSLDTILNAPLMNRENTYKKLNLTEDKPTIVLVQHPVTSQVKKSKSQIKTTLEALNNFEDSQVVCIYPNNDPGNEEVREELEKIREEPKFTVYRNMPHTTYLSLLRHCDVLVGNSSSGIIDSSGFGTPTVNIGIRQAGREASENVINVPHDKEQITGALDHALYDVDFREKCRASPSPYGDGNAGKKIAENLSKIKLGARLLQKQIKY